MDQQRARWFGLIAISLGVALIVVDSTIVNVAVPYIVRDLDLSSTEVQWVQESYTLVFAATLLVFGVIADRIGRRRMLVIGATLFAIASVIAATSPSGPLLIGSRVLQGVGGAMVLPTSLSLINATFTGRERGIAFAVWGSTIGGMAAVGPLLGGWLTTAFSWRWAFGINLPICVAIVVGTLLFVRESRAERAGALDVVGALLVAAGFGAIVFGLIEGREYGWWATASRFAIGSWSWPFALSPIPVAFALGILVLGAFIVRGRARIRAGRANLVDFRLLRIRSFRNGNLVAVAVSLGEFGIILALPIWLQNVEGLTALQTGLVLLALAVGSFAASGAAAATSGKLQPITVVRIGLVLEIVGVALAGVAVQPDQGWGWLVPCLFVYGVGVGLATAQLTSVVLVDVPVQQSGAGSGITSTARQIGSALGVAVLGTVLYSGAQAVLQRRLDDAGLPRGASAPLVDAVVNSAGTAIAGLEANGATRAVAAAARAAFSDSTAFAAYTAAAFLVIGLLASFSLSPARTVRPEPTAGVDVPAA
ncbi:DHA2 family efflux MFS transporter permease subunit [Amnibacterium kyonggiense]|uniref:EmrB/QacA subfamily drug resistance transporter n=1 Tax=Amnibacterium kyonggiense TaxID=595671 RepID=A0A4R7FPW4_9MICO|nr:DHA2 family efflux MFS transporter permease subunit [Amnibacterium kyonggiense]TDS79716.1 EmrB/QacA subfamily drug resistance transporter [Amnibacterium kyonggiense]